MGGQAEDKRVISRKPAACLIDKEPSIAAKEHHALSPERNKGLGSQLPSKAVEKPLVGLKLDVKSPPQGHRESQNEDGLPSVLGRRALPPGPDVRWDQGAAARPLSKPFGRKAGQLAGKRGCGVAQGPPFRSGRIPDLSLTKGYQTRAHA